MNSNFSKLNRPFRAIIQTLFLTLVMCISFSAQLSAQCDAAAGGFSAQSLCMNADGVDISATPAGDAVVPEGFSTIYVLTGSENLVILDVSEEPSFTVAAPAGLFTIHTLVYDPNTLDLGIVEVGVTTGVDVNNLLIQGGGDICASLDVAGAQFNFGGCDDGCAAEAGTLVAEEGACLENGTATLTATVGDAPAVPTGYEVLYVLTSGEELVIEQVNAEPTFDVESEGRYTIHTLVYDPNTLDLGIVEIGVTTGVDVNGLLIQGGGDICAALDVAGAVFDVAACEVECLADAGTLTPDEGACLENGTATLSATRDAEANVPEGYSLIYVLTSGEGLVIEQVNAEPTFDVESEGRYTIHTLVYDPNTLDLGIVEFGVTTGVDVNGLLIQGGGDICAALDVAGAAFDVAACESDCLANAGTLTPDEGACLENGTATLSATRDAEANVPEGYALIYVLTSGEGLVIEQVNAEPTFDVESEGRYTIHTLVYDPNTLDLGIVEIGVTTGVDVNGLLIQGGGDICAALDVAGAAFDVAACESDCTADAGTVTAFFQPCIQDGSTTLIGGYDDRPVVPEGYQTLFVLTTGPELTILQVNTEARFTVERTGTYRIHSLVYDPNTLDLGIVEFGVTTGVDVNNLLIQGGGDICASLDVAGAVFRVVNCLSSAAGIQGEIQAFPNPASSLINIDIPTIENASNIRVRLMDTNGSIVKEMDLEGVAQRATMDISNQTPGMYYLLIMNNDTVLKQMSIVKAE